MNRARLVGYRAIALVAALVALARLAATIPVYTNTIDEPFHLAGALSLYDVHKLVYGAEHPPLPRLVAGLPLYLSGVHLPPQRITATIQDEMSSCEAGAEALLAEPGKYEPILHRARSAMLIFPAIILLYVYLLGRWIAGELVGAAGVAFTSLDPTLLGHGMWICTDAAAAAGFLAALYHAGRWLLVPSGPRSVGAGAAIGLAVACKFTNLLLIPALLLVWLLRRSRPRPGLKQIAVACAVAFVLLWATYLFDVGPIADQNRFSPDSPWRHIPESIKRAPAPMPSFWIGLLWFANHARSGHTAYLNGSVSHDGWWYYFPEAIAIKSPLGLLLAMLGCILVWIYRRRLGTPRILPILVGLSLFLLVSVAGKVDIGIRHLMPVLPLLYLLACYQLIRARLAAVLLVCIGLAGAETALAHPDYLAFFNSLAGGPARGERYLLDSNLDWGQDLGRLADWLHSPEAAGRPYSLRVFIYPHEPLVSAVGLDPSTIAAPPRGLLAVSKCVRHRLFRSSFDVDLSSDAADYTWLQSYPRVKRIGQSIDIYDLDQPPSATASAQSRR